MRIGLFGGTFNPPHLGHTTLVEVICEQFALDRVWFIPSFIPPHKTPEGLADPFHRCAMVALALRRYPHFLISTEELITGTVRYTIDTVLGWRKKSEVADTLFFLMGSDSFLE